MNSKSTEWYEKRMVVCISLCRTCSLQGEYGNIIEAADMLNWLEENPGMAAKKQFAELKKLTEDSNPVVAITIPY